MTREEEIKQAAENYAASVCKDCAERFYCKERIRKCAEYREQVNVFADAVEWADEHPKNVWHDASEMPNNHSYIMLMIDRYTIKTDYVPACLKHCQLNGGNWDEFAKDANIRQWAYVLDLLPERDGV